MTHHHGPVALVEAELLAVLLVAAAVGYVAAARRVPWSAPRTARWLLGIAAAVAGVFLLALGGPADLRVHVAGHLLLGMVAPLLLVTAAPVTLALRALPRDRARTLARVLRARPLVVLTHPAVAAVLDVGGLWLMYRTDLLAGVSPLFVHAHMLLAGYLFAHALIGPDPAPHRPGLAVRAGLLVAAVAAHDVLAKLLYAAPPAGVPAAQAEAAGVLMYYGAMPVHAVLFVLLGREWARAQERRRARLAAPSRREEVQERPGGGGGRLGAAVDEGHRVQGLRIVQG